MASMQDGHDARTGLSLKRTLYVYLNIIMITCKLSCMNACVGMFIHVQNETVKASYCYLAEPRCTVNLVMRNIHIIQTRIIY